MTAGVQSFRSVQQNIPNMVLDSSSPVEIGQRLVIKYLNKTLSRLLQSNSDLHIGSQNEYVPNDEGDRAVWYLELLESQLDITERTLFALKNFTEKVSVNITGSISSAAQVKATSLELASNTKVTAEEVDQLKNIMRLVKADLDGLKSNMSESNIHH